MEKKIKERVDMVRAMELLARSCNDEDIFMGWLMCGVADGDIVRNTTDEEIVEMGYTDDQTFIDLMDCFLSVMKNAYKWGGLYAGELVSTRGEEDE